MAAVNLVILSSSPSKPPHHAPLTMSSSQDDPPSPSALFQSRPKLKMPTTSAKRMSTTFRTMSAEAEPPKKDDIWDIPDDDHPAVDVQVKAAARPRGRPRKEVAARSEADPAGAAPPKKRGRPKKVVAEGVENTAPKEKAVRKPRAKKTEEDGQTTIAKGRVTKAPSKTKATDTVSSHFTAASGNFIDIDAIPAYEDLQLKKAGERRMSWTPAKESAYLHQMENITPGTTEDDTAMKAQGFGSLLDNYSYAKMERSSSTSTMDENNPVRKRKLIELVKTGNAPTSKATETAKSKAVRKKPRTITDKATAEYAVLEEEETDSAPILQYFRREDSGVDPSGAPRTKARKIVTKPGKGKKATEPVSALLEPQAALEHAKRLEFVFGTSSQLARDDDPAFLRDLQQAMQLSNQYDVDDPFAEPLPSVSSTSTSGKAKLWEAAALIEEEGAKDIEVLDLTRSSQVGTCPTKEATPAPTTEAETSQHSVFSNAVVDDWIEIDQTPLAAPATSHVPSASAERASSPSPIVQTPAPPIPKTILASEAGNNADPSPSDSNVPMMISRSQPTAKRQALPHPIAQCPDYDSFSTTELTKEIAKYKFKPIKKREDMVNLLKKCLEGKQKQTLGVLQHIPKPAEAPPPSSQPAAPLSETVTSPRKRGRPRKGEPTTASMRKLDSKSTTAGKAKPSSASASALSTPRKRGRPRKVLPVPEDISDAEGPPTPSPPRLRATQIRSPPPLEIVDDADNDADATLIPLSPSSAERELFAAISKAVLTQTPSRDPKRLSWYEKILLYDPILLEDLTKWLNEEGLGRVEYDGEVQPSQVKSWCMRKSICCLFKESKRNRGVGGLKKIGRE